MCVITSTAAIIKGATIVATTTFDITPGREMTYHWKDHALKMHIPVNALDPDTPPATMTILASLRGHYQLPDNTELVSAIYWFAFPRRFRQPVTLELQHCAHLRDTKDVQTLSFITAKCTQKTLPYDFTIYPGGVFSSNSRYGCIELNHFSSWAISRRIGSYLRDIGTYIDYERYYTIKTYYMRQGNLNNYWMVDLPIVWNLATQLQVWL